MSGRFYDKRGWHRRRQYQMQIQPLCEWCLKNGKTVAAEVAHHEVRHGGKDINAFWLSPLTRTYLKIA